MSEKKEGGFTFLMITLKDANSSVCRQVVRLLIILFASIFAAFIAVGLLLHVYGPTGRYIAGNILLEPSLLQSLSIKGQGGRFIKDSIRFQSREISNEQYDQIYDFLKEDASAIEENGEIHGKSAILEISIKQDQGKISRLLQTVLFYPDSYRIKLFSESGEEIDAYFIHSQVYEKILEILAF